MNFMLQLSVSGKVIEAWTKYIRQHLACPRCGGVSYSRGFKFTQDSLEKGPEAAGADPVACPCGWEGAVNDLKPAEVLNTIHDEVIIKAPGLGLTEGEIFSLTNGRTPNGWGKSVYEDLENQVKEWFLTAPDGRKFKVDVSMPDETITLTEVVTGIKETFQLAG